MAAVTIGLPFRDPRGSLDDAIRSVFAQSFTDWELLLVDDGSTDGSREIAQRVDDPRVRVLSDGRHLGLGSRLNEIAAAATAGLVARLDADDMLHPDRIARQVDLLARRPEIDVVSTAMWNLDAEGNLVSVGAIARMSAAPFQVLRKNLEPHATMTMRRAWAIANPYDARYLRGQDLELFARVCQSLRREHLPEPLYLHWNRKDPAHTLRDYIASARSARRIFRDHGRALVGPLAVPPLVAESLMKEGVYRALTAVGEQRRLFERRGREPTDADRADVAAVLRRIRATRVPGLD